MDFSLSLWDVNPVVSELSSAGINEEQLGNVAQVRSLPGVEQCDYVFYGEGDAVVGIEALIRGAMTREDDDQSLVGGGVVFEPGDFSKHVHGGLHGEVGHD